MVILSERENNGGVPERKRKLRGRSQPGNEGKDLNWGFLRNARWKCLEGSYSLGKRCQHLEIKI